MTFRFRTSSRKGVFQSRPPLSFLSLSFTSSSKYFKGGQECQRRWRPLNCALPLLQRPRSTLPHRSQTSPPHNLFVLPSSQLRRRRARDGDSSDRPRRWRQVSKRRRRLCLRWQTQEEAQARQVDSDFEFRSEPNVGGAEGLDGGRVDGCGRSLRKVARIQACPSHLLLFPLFCPAPSHLVSLATRSCR